LEEKWREWLQTDYFLMLTPQFIKFVLAGGIAAVANFGSRFVFNIWTSYEVAIILAYLVGMTVAFILMRGQVFNAENQSLTLQVLKFSGVNLLAVLQTFFISILFLRYILPYFNVVDHAAAVAHLIGVFVPVLTSYFGHKYLTFK
jgi:putative flippase GtrA